MIKLRIMGETQNEPFRVYFAGASIAFGLPFMVLELLGLIYGGTDKIQTMMGAYSNFFIGVHLIGGVLGGYLAARGATGDLIRVGTVTGVLAFIIQQIVYTVFYGRGAMGDAYTMIGLIGGALSGAVIYKTKVDMAKRRTDVLERAKRAAREEALQKTEEEPVEKEDDEAEEEQMG